jgi:aminopeptidase 2
MAAAEHPELLNETFQFILDKAKDQDVLYFSRDLSTNAMARRLLAQFVMKEYDAVGVCA